MIRSVLLGLVCLLLGCNADDDNVGDGTERVDEIVHGVRDRGRHPAVIAVRRRDGVLCTGALVAPSAVLTARHCVSDTDEAIDCGARRNVYGEYPASAFDVTASEDALTGLTDARVTRVIVPAGQNLCGADVAVLVLDRALRSITPLAIETRAPRVGDEVTAVGYGRRGDAARSGAGVRYMRSDMRVFAVVRDELATSEGTCSGDSGGPLLDGHTGRVLAVLSRGAERCVGSGAVWTRASVARALIDAATR